MNLLLVKQLGGVLMTSISMVHVKKVAKLSRIRMSDEQAQNFTKELDNLIGVLDKLHEINTDNVQPLVSVSDGQTPLREDVVTDGNKIKDVVLNSPDTKYDYFVVPKVVE